MTTILLFGLLGSDRRALETDPGSTIITLKIVREMSIGRDL